mgnify:CR=1 FL=1|tara:strand:+ start:218 stop:457 length:240 start_codon:yes stop_codon:yes gene_type:complete
MVAILLKFDSKLNEAKKLFESDIKSDYITIEIEQIRSELEMMQNHINALGYRDMTTAEYEQWQREMKNEIKRQKIENRK